MLKEKNERHRKMMKEMELKRLEALNEMHQRLRDKKNSSVTSGN